MEYRLGSIWESVGDKDTTNKAKNGSSTQIPSQKMASIQARPTLYLDTSQPWETVYESRLEPSFSSIFRQLSPGSWLFSSLTELKSQENIWESGLASEAEAI